MSTLGKTFNNQRDLYSALGYPRQLTFQDYYGAYRRQDIASAIIDRPVDATWLGQLVLVESDAEETPFEQEWKRIEKECALKTVFSRADRFARIGGFSVILLGFDDVDRKDALRLPVRPGAKRKLVYVKVFPLSSVTITEWDEDVMSERYGLPTLYTLTTSSPSGVTKNVIVHWTRIVHVVGEKSEDDLVGAPALEPVFNRLIDLERIVGGSSEMFWRGAFPGYEGKVLPDYQFTEEQKRKLQDELIEFEHKLRRFLINEGIEIEQFPLQVADPSNHVSVQIDMIASAVKIPKRILIGSERGELASTDDRNNWFEQIESRRREYAEPYIIRPFVERMIEHGVLPEPKEGNWWVDWADLWAVSEEEQVKVGKMRTEALVGYASAPMASQIIPPKVFYEYFLGLSHDDVDYILSVQEQDAKDVVDFANEHVEEGNGDGKFNDNGTVADGNGNVIGG